VYKWERIWEPIGFDFWNFTLYLPEFNTCLNSNNFSAEILQYIRYWNTIYELWIEKAIVWEKEDIYTIWFDKKYWKNHYVWQCKTNWSDYNLSVKYQRELTKDWRLALWVTWNYNEWEIWRNRADMWYWKSAVSFDISWKF